jgi:hypothetical protein
MAARILPDDHNRTVLAYYFENHSTVETARKFNVSHQRITQIIHAAGYRPRRSTPRPKRFRPKNILTSREKFWSLVEVRTPEECWPWRGVRSSKKGSEYGILIYRGNRFYAHRLALTYSRHKSVKLWALHKCDNPPCCNPDHLYEGTPLDNVRDREDRRHTNKNS